MDSYLAIEVVSKINQCQITARFHKFSCNLGPQTGNYFVEIILNWADTMGHLHCECSGLNDNNIHNNRDNNEKKWNLKEITNILLRTHSGSVIGWKLDNFYAVLQRLLSQHWSTFSNRLIQLPCHKDRYGKLFHTWYNISIMQHICLADSRLYPDV